MEIQLKELIEKIKKDGVDSAEAEAGAIIENAKAKADEILEKAKSDAEAIIKKAKEENEKFVLSSEAAVSQAGRNLLISFRESVMREIKAILQREVVEANKGENLTKLIVKIIEDWNKPADDLSVILNQKDLDALEDSLLAILKEKMLGGVTLKANDNFDGGFRISQNNGEVFYDYSTDSVVDMLSNYLSPRVTALLKEAE